VKEDTHNTQRRGVRPVPHEFIGHQVQFLAQPRCLWGAQNRYSSNSGPGLFFKVPGKIQSLGMSGSGRVRQWLLQHSPPKTHPLVRAVWMGDASELGWREFYRTTGILAVLAISGLHVWILWGLCKGGVWCVRRIWLVALPDTQLFWALEKF